MCDTACSSAYECAPTREAVRVKDQVSEGVANLAERLRDRAVELVISKLKPLQAGEVRADAVRDGTWLSREGEVGRWRVKRSFGGVRRWGKRGVSVMRIQRLSVINSACSFT